jgi:4-oxalocrotonate tautomerase
MPYINVRILRPATAAQKRRLVAELTQSLVTILHKAPEHIHIVIDEIERENWGYAGALTADLARPNSATLRNTTSDTP